MSQVTCPFARLPGVEEPAQTHLRQPPHPPECAAGCQDQSRSAQGGQARIDYLNSGMRKELRTEFKRIMRVYEEFASEKNTRVTPADYTWRKKVASKGEKQTMIDWSRSKLHGARTGR